MLSLLTWWPSKGEAPITIITNPIALLNNHVVMALTECNSVTQPIVNLPAHPGNVGSNPASWRVVIFIFILLGKPTAIRHNY